MNNTIPFGYCHCGCGNKTTISKHTSNKYGRKKGEPTSYLTGHGFRLLKPKVPKPTREERIWMRVDKNSPNECWNWTGSLTKKGYGTIRINNKLIIAHRYIYELVVGSIPDGLYALHKCDNRKCVNPNHIFLGTKGDNARDMVTKGRSLIGVRNHKAKLIDGEIIEMRQLYNTGKYSQQKLANIYGVDQTQISRIVLHKHWKHI